VWEQPSTPAPYEGQQTSPWYTPPANAGSWNEYYRQPGTTQPVAQPYQMGADFRYNQPAGSATPMGGYTSQLEGFESGKLNDPSHTTAKYSFARLASRYAPTQQGFAQLMQDPEFQRLGMQSLGGGKLRLPNGDVIDVVRGFDNGGYAWQWGAETSNGQPTGYGAAQPPTMGGMDPWAQYAQQMQQWQQAQQAWQQQQMAAYAAMAQPYQMPAYQPMPAAPTQAAPAQTGYYAPPQTLPMSPEYGGYGYGGDVGLQAGAAASPYAPVFNYLAQGMPSPYVYG
jgi:hypothetical protein